MGTNAQRKKERHEKRRKEKRKRQDQTAGRQQVWDRQLEAALGSNNRHRQRLLQQVPTPWHEELSEDVAIFDDTVLASLPPESVLQAEAVREALRDALESRADGALKHVSSIPRGSLFSEWRLFLRGLVDWLADKPDAASEAWKRLDRERRPGRIATSMMLALRSGLEEAAPVSARPASAESSPPSDWDRFDAEQLYHARLLRRVRIDRAALRVAEAGLSVPEESPKLHLGPRKIAWLKRYLAEYQDTEPELSAALAQTALGRAFAQRYSDLFDDAVKAFPGPRHDRANRLLTFFYYLRFQDPSSDRSAEHSLELYLSQDLPQNKELSEPMRGAIGCQIHLSEAILLMQSGQGGGMFGFMFPRQEDTRAIRDHLQAAMKAAPEFRGAYKVYSDWLLSRLDDDRLTKAHRAPLEAELANVMQSWSAGVPGDVAPRLWLVDHLFEEERLEDARPHVEFLAASRQDDPRVRAMPWKWQLLEAFRLCRRKAWLAEVPARLQEAEALWPTWFSKRWLPYLKAALMFRSGQMEQYEEARRRICGESGLVRDSLADACLMMGAAQQMRVPSTELKPIREVVDRAVRNARNLPLDELIEAGVFFWDLHRAQLLYPAYRLHGKSIGTALIASLDNAQKHVLGNLDDERLQNAVLWGSENRFWCPAYGTRLPSLFSSPVAQRHPVYMAAKLNATFKERHNWHLDKCLAFVQPLREAAPSQRDAYHRHWFVALADRLEDELASSVFPEALFGNQFGREDDEYDNDDDDDDDDI